MFSSSKKEPDELLRYLGIRQPWKFEERQLLDTQNPRDFWVNFHFSEAAFAHLLELINLSLENTLPYRLKQRDWIVHCLVTYECIPVEITILRLQL